MIGNRGIKGLEPHGYGDLSHVVQTAESLQCICVHLGNSQPLLEQSGGRRDEARTLRKLLV